MNKMEIGADISSLIELENSGAYFYDFKNNKNDLFTILKDNGFTSIRIRLWNDPYDLNKRPYLGGTNDLEKALILAKRAKNIGFSIMLDFHYSDFWADPSKQTLPKKWKDITDPDLLKIEVYKYTKEVLTIFKNEGIDIQYVQIGNEITHGMLWPVGLIYSNETFYEDNFASVAKFLKEGIKASKEVYPNIKTIIHLEKSGYTKIYEKYLFLLKKEEVEYNILGMSYYPYWHKQLKYLENTFKLIRNDYQKDIMIVEYSFANNENVSSIEKEEPLIISNVNHSETNKVDYPYTVKGQMDFITDLYNLCKKYDSLGIYYWEPAWVNNADTSWASKEGMNYISEIKQYGNEWANQGLFTGDGHPLDSLKIFNKLKEE